MCRRISGAAISHVLVVKGGGFRVVSGREALSMYRSSANTERHHCGRCHAPIYAVVTDKPELGTFVPAGIVEDPSALASVAFEPIFAKYLARWHRIDWSGTVHEEGPY